MIRQLGNARLDMFGEFKAVLRVESLEFLFAERLRGVRLALFFAGPLAALNGSL